MVSTDYVPGYFATFGEGLGLDSQHYPMAQMPLDLSTVAGSVSWITPAFVENATFTTPDLSALVQGYIDSVAYSEGDPFLVRLERLGTAQKHNRGFKSFDSPDTPGTAQLVTLDVEWTEPLPPDLRKHTATVDVTQVSASTTRSGEDAEVTVEAVTATAQEEKIEAEVEVTFSRTTVRDC